MTRLEAVLFLAREPLSTRKLAQLAALEDGTEARTLVGRLNQQYDASRSAFRVEQLAGGFQLLTRPRYSPWLRRRHQMQVEVRLSSPAIETLAIIAYRQPVLRAEIEAIRGVKCGEIVRQLMERDLVRIAGKSDELGRPFLYGTTRRFLQVFGLRDIDELPRGELRRPDEQPSDGPNGPGEEPASAAEQTRTAESEPLDVSPLEEELAVKVSAKTRSASEGRAPRDVEGFEWEEVADVVASDPRNADEDEDEEEDEELDDEEEDDDEEELDDDEEEDDEDLEDDEEWEEVEDEDEEWDEEEDDEEEEDEDWDEEEEDDEEEWDDEDDDEDEDDEEEEEEGDEE